MDDRPSETYYCSSEGCFNGVGSSFEAAPEDWFTERGLTPPKNCPDCRAWIKAQDDEAVRCTSCGRIMRLSARLKISHHKRTGPWVLPKECRSCERGERPPRSAASQPRPNQASQVGNALSSLPVLRSPHSYPLDINPVNYTHPIHRGSVQTRQEHIEMHTDWSQHTRTKTNGGDRDPTALGTQSNNLGALLQSANIVTQAQSTERVREYVNTKNGNVVRVTLTDSARIEVTVIKASPGTNGHQDHELVTTFDGYTVDQVSGKLNTGEWR
jgi:hypothetical protein